MPGSMIAMDIEGTRRVVFDGRMHVAYGQAYLESLHPEVHFDYRQAFDGQINGLLGAGDGTGLYLTTGLHTGSVGFRLVIADHAPDPGPEWEELVELSFRPSGPSAVMQWGGDLLVKFDLPPVWHRARYCARGMDEGRAADVVMAEEALVDHYGLILWPADPAPEQIVRQTSEIAAYWHDVRHHVKARQRRILSWWGENPPSERLIDIHAARWLVRRRRDLAEALAAAEPAAQRAVAYWAARRCCAEARIDHIDPIAAALRMQSRNEMLPPGFERWPFLRTARQETQQARARAAMGDAEAPHGIHRQSWTLTALQGADDENPLLAAIRALTEGAMVFEDDEVFLSEAGEVLAAAGPGPDPRHDPYHGDLHARIVWGDEPPASRLRQAFPRDFIADDQALAEQLADASPVVQRAVARWAARTACTAAGLTAALPEVALALDHLDRGEALPPPFGEEQHEWSLLQREEAPDGTIAVDDLPNFSRPHYTLPVIRQASHPDPLRAAAHALWTAACSFGNDHRREVLDGAAALIARP
ncbi:hypothetical protein KIH74_17675 [Kineosporia sp. J2-2]|uniref:Uncharacterized protein n=1 Tax=Kineosporia corallincola TaxID=2835133 RepID=A0ABS5TI79_9ACTN|nr:hypothetical protein [Kineosporia corallincola]MBT0770777.1 hypothetical protein [Kineosporia corallincola]